MKIAVPGSSRCTAAYICSQLSTSTRRTPAGVGSDTGPLTSTTSAPASRIACASAKPILPELRLLTKRTGSMHSRVGPAVSSTRRPVSGPTLASSGAACDTISLGSSMRPGPCSPQACSPTPGPIRRTPRAASSSTLARVAALAPHLLVHGRRHRDRRLGRQAQRRQQIVRQAVREPREKIGARGRHQHQLGPARELDVPHGRLGRRVPQVGAHRAARERLERGRRDEFPGGSGHHDLHLCAVLDQAPHQVGTLVGRDTAGHPEQDAFALHAADYRPFWAMRARYDDRTSRPCRRSISRQVEPRRRA